MIHAEALVSLARLVQHPDLPPRVASIVLKNLVITKPKGPKEEPPAR